MIRALFGDERVIAPGHQAAGLCIAMLSGNLIDHTLRRRSLILAAERHQHGTCADGRVKAFGKSASGADVQIPCQRAHPSCEIIGCVSRDMRCLRLCRRRSAACTAGCARFMQSPGPIRARRLHCDMLFRAVRVQKGAGDVHNLLPVPVHHKARLFRNRRDYRRFQILGVGEPGEEIYILRTHHDRHSFLRFADRQFGTVQTLIFFWNLIQIDQKAVC